MTPEYLAGPPRENGKPRVFCFHTGKSDVFAGWRAELDVCPVRLPVRDLDTLVADLDVHLGPYLRPPFVFYGHRRGALVAHRFTLHRVDTGQSTPGTLVVGDCPPPEEGPRLPVPIHVLAGSSPTAALRWARHTNAVCRVHVVSAAPASPVVRQLVVAAAHNHGNPAEKLGGLRP